MAISCEVDRALITKDFVVVVVVVVVSPRAASGRKSQSFSHHVPFLSLSYCLCTVFHLVANKFPVCKSCPSLIISSSMF